MRILYIADDGTAFYDEYDCEHYEFVLRHQCLGNIGFLDENKEIIQNFMLQESYECTDYVIIHSNEELSALHEFASFTGFCSYHTIVDIGTWRFDYEEMKFVLIDEMSCEDEKVRSI